jgi:hypothetical protein
MVYGRCSSLSAAANGVGGHSASFAAISGGGTSHHHPQMGKAMNKTMADLMRRPENENDSLSNRVSLEPIPQIDLWDSEKEMTTVELDSEYNIVFTRSITWACVRKSVRPRSRIGLRKESSP